MKKGSRLWVIHSGPHGEAHLDFMTKPWISLGWNHVGDLQLLRKDRAAFRAEFEKWYPDTAASVKMKAGALYRFLHKLEPKHIVIYPSPQGGPVYLGIVEGEYKFRPQPGRLHQHVRKVKWFDRKDKEDLSRAVCAALARSARSTLCRPRKYARLLSNALLTKSRRANS